MATHLDVAIGIADLINEAAARSNALDVERQVGALMRDGIPSPLTPDIVASVLRSESIDAGVPLHRTGDGHAS